MFSNFSVFVVVFCQAFIKHREKRVCVGVWVCMCVGVYIENVYYILENLLIFA